MSYILSTALDYFRERGWPIGKHEDLPILRFEYEGENGRWLCFVRAREDAGQLVVLCIVPDRVPVERRNAIAEFITRANFGLNIGCFEMDFEDGELRYRTSLDIGQGRLSKDLVHPLVMAALVAMDDHLPGIKAVIQGGATPAEAVTAVREASNDVDFSF